MVFRIDLKKKKQLQKNYAKTKTLLYRLPLLLLVLMILFTLGILIYSIGDENAFLVQNQYDTRYGRKSVFFIVSLIVAMDIIFLFLYAISKLVVGKVAGKYLSERVTETLEINDMELIYGYQNASNLVPFTPRYSVNERVIRRVRLDSEFHASVDRNLQRIILYGRTSSAYFEDYVIGQESAAVPYNYGEFVMFDYFVPPLINILEQKGYI